MFLGPYEDVECEWDSPLDITAIISSIDLEPIIKATRRAAGENPSGKSRIPARRRSAYGAGRELRAEDGAVTHQSLVSPVHSRRLGGRV